MTDAVFLIKIREIEKRVSLAVIVRMLMRALEKAYFALAGASAGTTPTCARVDATIAGGMSGAVVRSGRQHLFAFEFDGERWALEPKTAFFYQLYIKALLANPELAAGLLEFDAFTDIEFNPNRQVNCQAAAAAFYVSLCRTGKLD